jgi:hypothetical protein
MQVGHRFAARGRYPCPRGGRSRATRHVPPACITPPDSRLSTDQLETAATALGPLLEEVCHPAHRSESLPHPASSPPSSLPGKAEATTTCSAAWTCTTFSSSSTDDPSCQTKSPRRLSRFIATSDGSSPLSAKTHISPTSPRARCTATDNSPHHEPGWVWLGIVHVSGGFDQACGRGASLPRVGALCFDGGVYGWLARGPWAVATDNSCL